MRQCVCLMSMSMWCFCSITYFILFELASPTSHGIVKLCGSNGVEQQQQKNKTFTYHLLVKADKSPDNTFMVTRVIL